MKNIILMIIAMINIVFADIQPYQDENGKDGFIDNNGKVVVEPKFDGIENFSDGLAGVKINGKWGFIDKSGNFTYLNNIN